MTMLGTLIALGAACAFAAIAVGIMVGIPYTLRTRVASRFRIMQNSLSTRIGSVVYFALVAMLPALLALWTAYELWLMVVRVWS